MIFLTPLKSTATGSLCAKPVYFKNTHTCAHAMAHTLARARTHAHTHVRAHTRTHTHALTHTHTPRTRARAHTHNTHARTLSHTHARTHVLTHIHTHTCSVPLLSIRYASLLGANSAALPSPFRGRWPHGMRTFCDPVEEVNDHSPGPAFPSSPGFLS